MKRLFKFIMWLLIFILLLVVGIFAFIQFHPTFGGKPDAASLQKINASKYFNGETFVNLEKTEMGLKKNPQMTEEERLENEKNGGILSIISPPKGKHPSEPLPTETFDKNAIKNGEFIWFGHSSVLFKSADQTIMTDPVFYKASPVPYIVKEFQMTRKPKLIDLPVLDAVIISHDHYDHLDYQAIKTLNPTVSHFYVPLGIKGHLQRWGVPDEKITELDWYESAQRGEMAFTLTPSRHFSGRGISDRNKTLWSSWVVKTPDLSLYFSGDSGYGKHFADIGKRFGPFDMALMDDGQYNKRWADIHMMPEESVKASVELGAKNVLPIHWGRFDLSIHHWRESIERFAEAAKDANINIVTPRIGQVFTLDKPPQDAWWVKIK